MLDKAATVDEAVELLKQYNIYFSGDTYCHYLIADDSGRSIIVEYYDDSLQVVETDTRYQIASNFIAYNNVNIGKGSAESERYDTVKAAIENNRGILSELQSLSLLIKIGIKDEDIDKLQWSVLYNLTTGDGALCAHRNIKNIIDFHIEVKE